MPETLDEVTLARLRYLSELKRQAEHVNAGVIKYYNDPVGFAHDCIDWRDKSLTQYQGDVMAQLAANRRVAVRAPHGTGKALNIKTLVPTPTGYSTIGDLRVGDDVFDETGRVCKVRGKSPVWYGPTYEVVFGDGSVLVTHANHEWNAVDVYNRPKNTTDWREHWDATRRITTEQMAQTLRSPSGQPRWRIPTAEPVRMPDAELPVDPYVLGFWLGDGTTTSGFVTVNRADAAEILPRLGDGHLIPSGDRPGSLGYRVSGLTGRLREIGVLGDKHIPMLYLRASVEQRRELVRGLWDSDGYRQESGARSSCAGNDEITLTNKRLFDDVAELLHSLGLVVRTTENRATLYGADKGPKYRLNARFDFNPYHLTRYAWKPRSAQASRHTQRTVVDVRRIDDEPTQCIEVDSPSHLYLVGNSFIPTHNSCLSAITVLWFCLTRDAAGTDWKVMTTAGAWRQLINYLWPEIRKWAGRLRWDRVRDKPFTREELMNLNLRLTYGAAAAAACSNPALIEGAHADSLLFVYDEAKAVPAPTWDACEGAFSGTGETFVLALSTPGPTSGRFYDIHTNRGERSPFRDWTTIHITLDDAIAAGQISADWAENRKRQWGENSALFQNRVLGEFYSGEENSVIPLSWVEAAIERWHDWDAAGRPDRGRPHTVGVDVARQGEDKTVLALRWDDVITELRVYNHEDTMTTAGRVAAVHNMDPSMTSIVDLVGVGAGVFDRLRELGYRTEPFNAATRSNRKDASGELGFVNTRAAAIYNLREMLDPSLGADLCLPDDDDMLGDLTAPLAGEIMSGGKIKIESKDDIRKRIGRSTDRLDAIAAACWTERGSWNDAYGTVACPCGRSFLREVNGVARTACPFCQATLTTEDDTDDEESV